jgi:hypothetical protein
LLIVKIFLHNELVGFHAANVYLTSGSATSTRNCGVVLI